MIAGFCDLFGKVFPMIFTERMYIYIKRDNFYRSMKKCYKST